MIHQAVRVEDPRDATRERGRGFEGRHAPIFEERVPDDLAVVGQLPKDLNDVYRQNGPDPRLASDGRDHWFDGDGRLPAAHVQVGRVTYRDRWIRTDGFRAEEGGMTR